MGTALLEGWLKAGLNPQTTSACVATNASAKHLVTRYGITAASDASSKGASTVILAVKPQILAEAVGQHLQPNEPSPLYISLAAGISLAKLQSLLGERARIIRAMPNTPALVGEGLTTLVAGLHASEADKHQAETLFSAVGEAIWLQDEGELDIATAIAGSGPAYVFYFGEVLASLAQEMGLPPSTGHILASQTLKGSVALAEKEGWDLRQLRRNVTSKGGVTQAALDVLMADEGLKALMQNALEANIKRSGELG